MGTSGTRWPRARKVIYLFATMIHGTMIHGIMIHGTMIQGGIGTMIHGTMIHGVMIHGTMIQGPRFIDSLIHGSMYPLIHCFIDSSIFGTLMHD